MYYLTHRNTSLHIYSMEYCTRISIELFRQLGSVHWIHSTWLSQWSVRQNQLHVGTRGRWRCLGLACPTLLEQQCSIVHVRWCHESRRPSKQKHVLLANSLKNTMGACFWPEPWRLTFWEICSRIWFAIVWINSFWIDGERYVALAEQSLRMDCTDGSVVDAHFRSSMKFPWLLELIIAITMLKMDVSKLFAIVYRSFSSWPRRAIICLEQNSSADAIFIKRCRFFCIWTVLPRSSTLIIDVRLFDREIYSW